MKRVRRSSVASHEDATLLRTLFDKMLEGFAICEVIRDEAGRVVDYRLVEANPSFAGTRPGAELIGRRISEVRPDIPPAWFTACHLALKGRPVRFEYEDERAGRWYEVQMTRLTDDKVGQFFTDVTDRKKAEAHNEAMFDELNHRVKNNLMVVAAVLNLQARSTDDPWLRQQLSNAVDRIQSIADLHASMYQRQTREMVDAGAYLGELCERLSGSLLRDSRVTLKWRADSFSLPLGQAVQLAIVANELITNAAKHAYPSPEGGQVLVTVESLPGAWRLTVADSGRGLVADPSPASVGLRLVRSLVERGAGRLDVISGEGLTVVVEMPSLEKTEGVRDAPATPHANGD